MLHGNVGMVDGRTGKRMRPVHRLSPEITPDRLSHQPTQTRVKMSITPCMRAALAEQGSGVSGSQTRTRCAFRDLIPDIS